jgi:hypothetical protein
MRVLLVEVDDNLVTKSTQRAAFAVADNSR